MADDIKNAFLLYLDYESTFRKLSPNQCQRLIFALFDYEARQKQPNFHDDLALEVCFSFIQRNLDRDRAKYDKRCETSKENGKKGGAKPGNQNARKRPKNDLKQPKQAKQPDIERDTDTDIDTEIETVTERDISALFPSLIFDEAITLSLDEYRQAANQFNCTAWLRENFKHLSTIHDNFEKIVTGKYRDYKQSAAEGLLAGKTIPSLSADRYTIKKEEGHERDQKSN